MVVSPKLPPRVPPPECLVDADQPIEPTRPPEWMRVECKDNACRERKAKEAAKLTATADGKTAIERERRLACVKFIGVG